MKIGEALVVVAFVAALGHSMPAVARTFDCGKPPPLADEQMKVEIGAKAQAASKSLSGDVSGSFQHSRAEVLSRYPNADRALADAYFNYEVCSVVMNDPGLTSDQKLRRIEDARRYLSVPVRKLNLKPSPPRPAAQADGPRAAVVPPAPTNSASSGGVVIGSMSGGVFNQGSIPLARREYLPKLQEFYSIGQQLYARSQGNTLTDTEVEDLYSQFSQWDQNTTDWLSNNMTQSAASKFNLWQRKFGVSYELVGTHSEQVKIKYINLNVLIPQLLDNLQYLMSTDAMDPQK